MLYYRLEMVDHDGRISYSKVAVIKLNGENSQLVITPNPAHDHFIINTDNLNLNNAMVVIRDLTGRTVLTEKLLSTSQKINITHLSSGIYTVSVITSEKTVTEKLFIRK